MRYGYEYRVALAPFEERTRARLFEGRWRKEKKKMKFGFAGRQSLSRESKILVVACQRRQDAAAGTSSSPWCLVLGGNGKGPMLKVHWRSWQFPAENELGEGTGRPRLSCYSLQGMDSEVL